MDNLYKDLFEIGVSGSIHKLAAEAYKLWGNPISIIDVHYNVLCMFPHRTIDEGTWDRITVSKRVPDTMLLHFIEARYLEESSKVDKAVLVDWGIAEKIPRIVCRISTNGAILGFLSVVLQHPASWTEEDSTRLEMFSRAAGLVMQRSMSVAYNTNALQPAFFSALLDQTIYSQETLQKWMTSLSFSPKKYFWIAAFAPLLNTGSFTLHFEYVFKHVKKQFSNCFSTCVGDCIYVLFNSDHLGEIDDHIIPKELSFYLKNGFGVGFSRPYKDILHTAVYKKQADSALHFGTTQKEQSPQGIFRYEQFVTEDLITCLCHHFPRENLAHPAVQILKEYDANYKTEYYLTLKYFIISFFNHTYCLEKLCIHRNTLLYRLKKIESVAQIDLSDQDTCFNLLMKFKSEEFVGR